MMRWMEGGSGNLDDWRGGVAERGSWMASGERHGMRGQRVGGGQRGRRRAAAWHISRPALPMPTQAWSKGSKTLADRPPSAGQRHFHSSRFLAKRAALR